MSQPVVRDERDASSLSDNEKGDKLGDDGQIAEPSEANTAVADSAALEKGGTEDRQQNFKDWDGPDDPGNPQNWKLGVRMYHAVTPGLFGFAVTFGTSVYTPATFEIAEKFHVSRTAAIVGLTVYTLGLSLGPVFSAPLSEKFGRKIVYLLSLPVFMLFTLGTTGSPGLAVGAGSNADLFRPEERAIATGFFLMAPFAGPSLGPVIGGFAAQHKGWRWTQWCIIFISLAVYILALPMKETYKPIILRRRAQKAGITPPESGLKGAAAIKFILVTFFLRPIHMLVSEPIVFFFSLYTGYAFGILFILFAAIPYTFERPPYQFSISQAGLVFLAIGLGVVLATLTSVTVDRKLYQKQHKKALAEGRSNAHPEHRLYTAMIGSFGIPIGLFWFAWTADKGVHWSAPVIALVPFAWGNLCVFTSAAMYLVDVYGFLNGASAIAANGIMRYTLGACFPLFAVQMYQNLGIGWATSLLGFLSLFMLPIPWIFFKYGPAIRRKSRFTPAI